MKAKNPTMERTTLTTIISIKEQIQDILRGLMTSKGQSLLDSLISLKTDEGNVVLIFEASIEQAKEIDLLRHQAEDSIKKLPGVNHVQSVLSTPRPSPKPKEPEGLLNVRHTIAVASGKGGVGKSTTALNLSVAFMQLGLKTGLLDADIYGPSLHRLFSITQKPDVTEDKKLVPILQHGISCMSIGFMVSEEMPMVWRGPMVHSALQQMLKETLWPNLDILVVDMPPGTGDAHLTLCQQAKLSGAVIVSTPQDIALIDARKGIGMFQRVGVPVLGIIENMSQFICPNCGHISEIFSHGGAQREAESLSIPFLGELPLDISIRLNSDQGMPITLVDPESPISETYRGMAKKIIGSL
jgi:ATP-binding protein involved in chromosome partitioning